VRAHFHSNLPSATVPSRVERRPVGGDAALSLPAYAVGIVNYHSYDDLDRCLASLKQQSLAPAMVVVLDADPELDLLEEARDRHPEVIFEAVPNRGYSAGANHVLELVAEDWPGVDFVLLLNPDVELELSFAENLLRAMLEEPDVALACGKLFRPGGQLLDSAGIALPAHRRPRDRGSEQPDTGQFETREFVFGATGAAMMLRRAALPELAIDGEIFDEDFFAYHEDTDLSWRANLLGWRVLYEPGARGIHVRGWRRDSRSDVSIAVRRHSFKNHYLQLIKNEPTAGLVRRLPVLLAWETMRLGFALLRDRDVLPAYRDAWRLAGRALAKRRALQPRRRAKGLSSL
jgi:GT2 family glycosyltransferase